MTNKRYVGKSCDNPSGFVSEYDYITLHPYEPGQPTIDKETERLCELANMAAREVWGAMDYTDTKQRDLYMATFDGFVKGYREATA